MPGVENGSLLTIADGLMSDWNGDVDKGREFKLKRFAKGTVDFEIFERMSPAWQMMNMVHDLSGMIQARRRYAPRKPSRGTQLRTIRRARQQLFLKINRPEFETFKAQLKHVRTYADLRRDRHHEILSERSDIFSAFGLNHLLETDRSKWTVMLLSAVQTVMSELQMPLKYLTFCPRPVDYSRRVMPIIETPTHSSFPSGHACEAFVIATVLECLTNYKHRPKPGVALGVKNVEDFKNDLPNMQSMRIAARIAENRVVAGVHFPVDNAAGALAGVVVGLYFVWALASRCGKGAEDPDDLGQSAENSTLPKFKMRGNEWATLDFDLEIFRSKLVEIKKPSDDKGPMWYLAKADEQVPVPRATPLLEQIWDKAVDEWKPIIGTE